MFKGLLFKDDDNDDIDVGAIEDSDDPGKDDSVEKLEAMAEYDRVIEKLKGISFRERAITKEKDRLLEVLRWEDFLDDKSDDAKKAYKIINSEKQSFGYYVGKRGSIFYFGEGGRRVYTGWKVV